MSMSPLDPMFQQSQAATSATGDGILRALKAQQQAAGAGVANAAQQMGGSYGVPAGALEAVQGLGNSFNQMDQGIAQANTAASNAAVQQQAPTAESALSANTGYLQSATQQQQAAVQAQLAAQQAGSQYQLQGLQGQQALDQTQMKMNAETAANQLRTQLYGEQQAQQDAAAQIAAANASARGASAMADAYTGDAASKAQLGQLQLQLAQQQLGGTTGAPTMAQWLPGAEQAWAQAPSKADFMNTIRTNEAAGVIPQGAVDAITRYAQGQGGQNTGNQQDSTGGYQYGPNGYVTNMGQVGNNLTALVHNPLDALWRGLKGMF